MTLHLQDQVRYNRKSLNEMIHTTWHTVTVLRSLKEENAQKQQQTRFIVLIPGHPG